LLDTKAILIKIVKPKLKRRVIFSEVHGMQIHHSLNSQTGYLGAKVTNSKERITIFIEGSLRT